MKGSNCSTEGAATIGSDLDEYSDDEDFEDDFVSQNIAEVTNAFANTENSITDPEESSCFDKIGSRDAIQTSLAPDDRCIDPEGSDEGEERCTLAVHSAEDNSTVVKNEDPSVVVEKSSCFDCVESRDAIQNSLAHEGTGEEEEYCTSAERIAEDTNTESKFDNPAVATKETSYFLRDEPRKVIQEGLTPNDRCIDPGGSNKEEERCTYAAKVAKPAGRSIPAEANFATTDNRSEACRRGPSPSSGDAMRSVADAHFKARSDGRHKYSDAKGPNGTARDSEPYISIRGFELSEYEANYLYGIKRSDENSLNVGSMYRNDDQPKRKVATYSIKRIEELSKPRNVASKKIVDHNEGNKTESSFPRHGHRSGRKKKVQMVNFLERMEATERKRREKMERLDLERRYEAMIGKKACPNCGGMQSYDELVEGMMVCPNVECGGEYKYKSAKFVLREFESRMQRNAQRRNDTMERIVHEQRTQKERGKREKSRKQKELSDKLGRSGKSFLDRMADDTSSRKMKMNRLEKDMQEQVKKHCTFKPMLNTPSRHVSEQASRNDVFSTLAEPKHRKTNERPRHSGGTAHPSEGVKKSSSNVATVRRPSKAPKRMVAARKGEGMYDPNIVAKKLNKLLL